MQVIIRHGSISPQQPRNGGCTSTAGTERPLARLHLPASQRQPALTHSSPAAVASKMQASSETPANTDASHSGEPAVAPRAAQPFDGSAAETREANQSGPLLTLEQLQRIAEAGGRRLQLRTLGPFYRITCSSKGAPPQQLGISNGFVVPPLRLMHCDTLEVFANRPGALVTPEERRQAEGVGLLLRTAVFAYGHACGCAKAEILAINDDDHIHQRLVAYYRRMGFIVEREVEGGRLSDLPHLLVWGGVGTRMNGDVQRLLRRWSKALLARTGQTAELQFHD